MRDGDRTVLTMVNDYQGEATEFALVAPTPVVLQREQIHVSENAIIDHLDAYTAPRLVEYFDDDPCAPQLEMRALASPAPTAMMGGAARDQAKALGVTIEAEYTVGEYDILILSAEQSDGLQTWLDSNGYKTPPEARPVLASYLAQGMKFFVARINLEEQAKIGATQLRPLQIAYESEKFMLPIRLGTVNSRGSQDLLLFTLTRTGRVETSNYRTSNIPSDLDIPLFVQDEFAKFYKDMFSTAVKREGGAAIMTEYAWDMGWCDPCAADPLSIAELRELGAYWLPAGGGGKQPRPRPGRIMPQPQAVDVYVTRLHARYDAKSFPEDLRLHETGDRSNFQGRYVTRHPYKGEMTCSAGDAYRAELKSRYEREAKQLASITGWDISEIRAKMAAGGQDPSNLPEPAPWWKGIWKD